MFVMWPVFFISVAGLVGLIVVMVLLEFIRKKSGNKTIRALLDFVNGLLIGLSLFLIIKSLIDLGWLRKIDDALTGVLWILGEGRVWKYLLMVAVESVLFYFLWKRIVIPILPFGSNFIMIICALVCTFRFSLQLVLESFEFDGFKCMWAFLGAVLICFTAICLLLVDINIFRCPDCHTTHNASHSGLKYIGDRTESDDYDDSQTSVDSGSNHVTKTTTTKRRTKYITYAVYQTTHTCGKCGYVWTTHESFRKGYDDILKGTEVEKETVSW